MAIEHFGLMDALPLTEDVLQAAAAYLWSLEGAGEPMGRGMGGEGGMRRGGMRRDTVSGG